MSMRLWKSGALFAALALSACQVKGGNGAENAAPGARTAAAGVPGCRAYRIGKEQVIRTVCAGTLTFTLGSTSGKMGGGSCEHVGQMSNFIFGEYFQGRPPPNYFPDYAVLSATGTGDFTGGTLTLRYSKKLWISKDVHGHLTASGGTFQGPVYATDGSNDQSVVKGSFTC